MSEAANLVPQDPADGGDGGDVVLVADPLGQQLVPDLPGKDSRILKGFKNGVEGRYANM